MYIERNVYRLLALTGIDLYIGIIVMLVTILVTFERYGRPKRQNRST